MSSPTTGGAEGSPPIDLSCLTHSHPELTARVAAATRSGAARKGAQHHPHPPSCTAYLACRFALEAKRPNHSELLHGVD
jgi:hypothetical protein